MSKIMPRFQVILWAFFVLLMPVGGLRAQGNLYQTQLFIGKEIACYFPDYALTPEAIENLIVTDHYLTFKKLAFITIPKSPFVGLEITTEGHQFFEEKITLIPYLSNKNEMQFALIVSSLDQKNKKRPLLTTNIRFTKADGNCENSQILTWEYDSEQKISQRAFYTPQGKLQKEFGFNREVLSLDLIYPELGVCDEDFVYLDYKSAQKMAQTPKLVKIAILDSGVDYNHPYLAPLIDRDQVLKNSILPDDDSSANFWSEGPMTFSHGTAVAFAATQMDARISLLPFKIEDVQKSDSILPSLKEALSYKPDILNMSFVTSGENKKEIIQLIQENPNTLFVVAAGNEHLNLDLLFLDMIPTKINLPNVIKVASNSWDLSLSKFSNYGSSFIDVSYFGEDIPLPLTQMGEIPLSGTSFSAPLVANIAANMKMVNPKLTPAQIKEGLIKNSLVKSKIKPGMIKGGVVDPVKTLEWAKAHP